MPARTRTPRPIHTYIHTYIHIVIHLQREHRLLQLHLHDCHSVRWTTYSSIDLLTPQQKTDTTQWDDSCRAYQCSEPAASFPFLLLLLPLAPCPSLAASRRSGSLQHGLAGYNGNAKVHSPIRSLNVIVRILIAAGLVIPTCDR